MTTPLTLSVTQVAALLGCDKNTVYGSLKTGTCTLRHLRAGRRVVFPVGTLCADLGIAPAVLVSLGLLAPDTAALFADPPVASEMDALPTPLATGNPTRRSA